MGKTRGHSTAAKPSRAVRFAKSAQELWQNNMAAQKDVDELKTCHSALSCLLARIAGELEDPHLCQPKLRAKQMFQWAQDMSKNHLQQVQLPESLLYISELCPS